MRQSSIELLRLIVMFFVLVLHTNYLSIGQPSFSDVSLVEFTTRTFIESFNFIAVIVFVLISGYFSIKPSKKSVVNYLFVCLFYSVGLRIAYFVFHDTLSPYKDLSFASSLLFLSNSSWFVVDYLALMVFAPILNNFVENCSKKVLQTTIILILIFSTYFGLITRSLEQYIAGFSFVTFLHIYLIGRYLNKYQIQMGGGVLLYLTLTVLTFAMSFISAYINKGGNIVWTYTNPLFILAGVFFFLLFIRNTDYNSPNVNRIAKSTFAIYLIHSNPAVVYAYIAYFKYLHNTNTFGTYLILMILSCIVVFIFSLLVDQIRIYIYNKVVYPLIFNR